MRKNKTTIIAEIGVNHNGSIKIAEKLIKIAKSCEADYAKFQYFKASNLALKNCPLVDYQKKNNFKNQFELLKRYSFDIDKFKIIKKKCENNKIKFLLSVFSKADFIDLENNFNLKEIKIPSGELENYELLDYINYKKVKIFLSTGMSNLRIITNSLNVIAKKKVFKIEKQKRKIINKKIHKNLKKKIILMHCVSNYPVTERNSGIYALEIFKQFDLPLGYSDHTIKDVSSIASYMIGARTFEKHITLDKNMDGPDHKASITFEEFKDYIYQLKILDKILQFKKKIISENEIPVSKLVKKSLVAKTKISKGESFSKLNLTTKRPGTGISSSKYLVYLKKKSNRNYLPDELIKY